MMHYTCAIREVKTKLEVLNDELSVKNQRNPIEMIKSRVKKPLSIVEKLLSQSGIALKPEDIYGLYLNCQFDGKQLLCTTGTSLKIFTLDKQLDRVWDEMVRKFFRKNQVAFEDA